MDSKFEQPVSSSQCSNTPLNSLSSLELNLPNHSHCACFICSRNKFQPATIRGDADNLSLKFAVGHYLPKETYRDILDGISPLFSKSDERPQCSYIEFNFTEFDQQLFLKISTNSYSNFFNYDEEALKKLIAHEKEISVTNTTETVRLDFKRTTVVHCNVAVDLNEGKGLLVDRYLVEHLLNELVTHEAMRPGRGQWFPIGSTELLRSTLDSFCRPMDSFVFD